ncbi:hypothetical protein M407DRAFT_241144 [Tulasnella calospora MUT 4182]|uniref:Uncharacterized protein n=1 Tax=Tulasnella calospora MUT 4182 TaxID=1051891 RepID=A0A0C3QUJ3_9AGAM|nr:hypothetical protein M407DRAFT_241144 [Tulasnella calospora MUT 4182]
MGAVPSSLVHMVVPMMVFFLEGSVPSMGLGYAVPLNSASGDARCLGGGCPRTLTIPGGPLIGEYAARETVNPKSVEKTFAILGLEVVTRASSLVSPGNVLRLDRERLDRVRACTYFGECE